MRVVPTDVVADPVDFGFKARTSRSNLKSKSNLSVSGNRSDAARSFSYWIQEEFKRCRFVASGYCCVLGIVPAFWALLEGSDENLSWVISLLGVSALVAACSLTFWALRHRLRSDFAQVLSLVQAASVNAAVMSFLIAIEIEQTQRVQSIALHSLAFKLWPLLSISPLGSIPYLAFSFLMDVATQVAMASRFGTSIDGLAIGFSCMTTLFLMSVWLIMIRYLERLWTAERDLSCMHILLPMVLSKAYDSWLTLDCQENISSSHHDFCTWVGINPVGRSVTSFVGDALEKTGVKQALGCSGLQDAISKTMVSLQHCVTGEAQNMELAIVALPTWRRPFRLPASRSMSSIAASWLCPKRSGTERMPADPGEIQGVPCYVAGFRHAVRGSSPGRAITPPQEQDGGTGGAAGGADEQEGHSEDASVLPGARLPGARSESSASYAGSSKSFDPVVMKAKQDDEKFESLHARGRKEFWLADPDQLDELPDEQILGSGSFGTVRQALYYGTPVAIKAPTPDKREHLPLLNELRTLRHLKHPNIVLFLGAHVAPAGNDMSLIFELIDGKTLKDWVNAQPKNMLCGANSLTVIRGICLALRYLHQQASPMVHGDLKSSNVFVEEYIDKPKAKLGDFGLSRFLSKKNQTMGGSVAWMAPEIVSGKDRSPSSATDIFSFGALMSFTVTDKKPCSGLDRQQIIKRVRKKNLPELAWPYDSDLSMWLQELGNRCYAFEPEQRPNICEVLQCLTKIEEQFYANQSSEQTPDDASAQDSVDRAAETADRAIMLS
eukprot:TRINITY_DN102131_c0_g1_i1.p1 TRINITY_DN102131_c0_g1~~TRINITY_DN102131_c0_g1_i1.p1  ORF type:complete len:779 (-),score=137.14 TRINITY_DN102131_c0_g1_i1:29-2365(-)